MCTVNRLHIGASLDILNQVIYDGSTDIILFSCNRVQVGKVLHSQGGGGGGGWGGD